MIDIRASPLGSEALKDFYFAVYENDDYDVPKARLIDCHKTVEMNMIESFSIEEENTNITIGMFDRQEYDLGPNEFFEGHSGLRTLVKRCVFDVTRVEIEYHAEGAESLGDVFEADLEVDYRGKTLKLPRVHVEAVTASVEEGGVVFEITCVSLDKVESYT